MKKRLLSLILIAALLMSSLALIVGCDEEETGSEPSSDEGGETQANEAETLDDTMFNIFFNKSYLCAFVSPKDATGDDAEIAKEFKNMINKLTGKHVSIVSEDEIKDEYKYLVLIGNTSFQESKDAYKGLGEREAIAKIVGNKLVIAFENYSSGSGMVKAIKEELSKNADTKKEIRLSLEYKGEYKALPEVDDMPIFEGDGQGIFCGDDTIMSVNTSTNLSEFEAYCSALESAEYKKLFSRKLEGNAFATFAAENDYIYVY